MLSFFPYFYVAFSKLREQRRKHQETLLKAMDNEADSGEIKTFAILRFLVLNLSNVPFIQTPNP